MANKANIERIQKDIYPITCAMIRKYLEEQVLGFKLHGLDVKKWNSPNGRAAYAVIRISMFAKDVAIQRNITNYVDKVLAEESMYDELDKTVTDGLAPFMFPENIAQAKQSYETRGKLWERGIESEKLYAIIQFSQIRRVKKYNMYICYLRPEKIIEQMLEDPATNKIDGSFGIPYSNMYGTNEQDFIWYPVISHDGEVNEPVSLDVLYQL